MGKPKKIPKSIDRFVGCLLGLACGDALGAPVEDWSHAAIRSSLGFVRDYQTTILGRGIITDDTMMTILLAESIIQNEHFDPSHFAYTIGEWMRRIDQGEEPGRGAGQTVSLAARRLYKGTFWKRSGEFSAGNSAAVRVSPLGLFHCKHNEDDLLRDAAESAVPTHIDPLAIAGAQVFALAICRLMASDYEKFNPVKFAADLAATAQELSTQVADSVASVGPRIEGRQVDEIAWMVPGGPMEIMPHDRNVFLDDDIKTVIGMGVGKFILQTLPAALYCFLAYPYDLESAILCAVNSGGDADTIGAMTGALAGTFNGAQTIPSRWLTELEKKDHLIELSNMLYDLATEGHTKKDFGSWRVVE